MNDNINNSQFNNLLEQLRYHLEKIKNQLTLITRDWFLSMHTGDIKFIANQWFDNLADIGSTHVTKNKIKSKQDFLKDAVTAIENYANTFVAHTSTGKNQNVPSFGEQRKAIASIFYIFNWCSLLLTSSNLVTPVPKRTFRQ